MHRVWEYFVASQIKASEECTAPLSSAPCTPAPGRRIIIIRCDNQVTPANLFVSFDRVVPLAPPENTALSRKSSDSSLSTTDSSSSESQAQPKRKWSILKAMFGASSSSKSSDTQSSSNSDMLENQNTDTTLTTDKCLEGHPQQRAQPELIRPKTAHQPFFFKFSLEWTDRPQWPTRNRRILPPSLPAAAQFHLQQLRQPKLPKAEYNTAPDGVEAKGEETSNGDHDEKPTTTDEQAASLPHHQPLPTSYPVPKAAAYDKVVASKYVGRALAEWGIVVTECDSFFIRRRDEGVPCDRLVETPTLGVEFFRR